MIDLDAIWSPEDELYCQLGVKFLLGYLSWTDWRKLVSFFSFYRYVLPDDRVLNDILMDAIFRKTRKTGAEMLRFALLVGQIEAAFTEQEQARMLSILISSR